MKSLVESFANRPATSPGETKRNPAPSLAFSLDELNDQALDLLEWDARIQELERWAVPHLHLCVGSPSLCVAALTQFLDRYQRLWPPPLTDPELSTMKPILDLHLRLHDLSRPLVRADYDHALDTWRWLLRLAPQASIALQCAALFHDIERLVSEADARHEHLASDYSEFKQRHARQGAKLLRRHLAGLPLDPDMIEEACLLVVEHERPRRDARVQLLNDADALSFLSLNSYGYLRYFGPEQTRRKFAYTLSRLSPDACEWARQFHYHPLLEELRSAAQGPANDFTEASALGRVQ